MKIAQTDNHVFERICTLLRPYNKTGCTLTPQTRIVADLEIDSVGVFDLIMEIEDNYDLSFPMETVSEIYTIGELAETVERLRHA